MRLTKADALAIEREYCRRSLASFVKRAWHVLEPVQALQWGWVLDVVCEHLEAVTRGEIKRLLINIPPGCMKSLLVGVFWPAWEWGAQGRPHTRFLGTAHKETLATRDNLKCRRLIQSKWFQSLWPVELTSDQNAKTKFENASTGFREAMAFTSLTGSRGDRLIIDDPLSVDDANSMTALMSVRQTFKEAVPTRLNGEDSAIVIIMQRLHELDVSGVILEEDMPYTHLCLPMRYEGGGTSYDCRTEDGELLFPELYPDSRVSELERTLGTYATAGQLQQRPTPRGGGIFKQEWLKYYQSVPRLQYRAIFMDTAQKTKESNDFTVMQCWGLSQDGGAYLLDQLRGKYEAPELTVNAKAFWQKHTAINGMGALRKMYIEDKVSGTGLIQQFQRDGIPVEGIKRNTDKQTRAYDAAPLVETGRVYLPESAPWLSDFIRELVTFPAGAHDDQVDPFMDAVSHMLYLKATSFHPAMLE